MKRHSLFCGIIVALIAGSAQVPAAANAAASEAVVSSGDKLHVEVFGEPKFSGDFTIDDDGAMAVPWFGRLQASGLTPVKIEEVLGERLRGAYFPDPKLSVSIVTYRAFSVLGDVNSPGRYAYAPGMNLLGAVAAAGGFRHAESELGALARAREAYQVQTSNYRSALARQARLLAERDGAAEISFPEELTQSKTVEVQALLDTTRKLFAARRTSLTEEADGMDKEKEALRAQINYAKGLIEAKERQQKLISAELGDVSGLANKGLVTRPSLLLLQRTAAELEGDRLQAMITVSQAQQGITKLDNTIDSRRNVSKTEILQQLQEASERVAEYRVRMTAAAEMLHQQERLAGEMAQPPAERRPIQQIQNARFYVLRGRAGATQIEVKGEDPILPGDVITIELPSGNAGATVGKADDTTIGIPAAAMASVPGPL